MNRRQFLKQLGSFIGVAVAGPKILELSDDPVNAIEAVEDLSWGYIVDLGYDTRLEEVYFPGLDNILIPGWAPRPDEVDEEVDDADL